MPLPKEVTRLLNNDRAASMAFSLLRMSTNDPAAQEHAIDVLLDYLALEENRVPMIKIVDEMGMYDGSETHGRVIALAMRVLITATGGDEPMEHAFPLCSCLGCLTYRTARVVPRSFPITPNPFGGR